MTSKKKAIGVAVGSAFVAGMAMTPMANAADNPFALQSLQGGYMVAADTTAKAPEAKCGQGKCGGMKSGEAKCGAAMLDANKDGKVSKEEFMKAHEAMFAAKDANKDGVLDANEMKPGMEGKYGGMKSGATAPAAAKTAEAKCGQGKCGAMPKK
jgi:uncharacterized low-complexity protein